MFRRLFKARVTCARGRRRMRQIRKRSGLLLQALNNSPDGPAPHGRAPGEKAPYTPLPERVDRAAKASRWMHTVSSEAELGTTLPSATAPPAPAPPAFGTPCGGHQDSARTLGQRRPFEARAATAFRLAFVPAAGRMLPVPRAFQASASKHSVPLQDARRAAGELPHGVFACSRAERASLLCGHRASSTCRPAPSPLMRHRPTRRLGRAIHERRIPNLWTRRALWRLGEVPHHRVVLVFRDLATRVSFPHDAEGLVRAAVPAGAIPVALATP
jgi:hypothetical protein